MATYFSPYDSIPSETEFGDFSAQDVDGWLCQIESFFDQYLMAPEQRLAVIHNYLAGEATYWHYKMYMSWRLTTWESFVTDLRHRFKPTKTLINQHEVIEEPDAGAIDLSTIVAEEPDGDKDTEIVDVADTEVTADFSSMLVLNDAEISEECFGTKFCSVKIPCPQHYCTHSLEIWLRSYANHGRGVFGATHTILAVIITARDRKDFNLSLSFGWLTVFPLFGGDTNDTADVDYAKGLSQYEFVEGITRDSIHILGVGHKIKIANMPSSEYIFVVIVKGTLSDLFGKHTREIEREWKSDRHEYVVRELKEYDGKKLVSPTNEGFTVDENDVRENFDNALIKDAIFDEEVTNLVFLVRCISKFLMFSSPRPLTEPCREAMCKVNL